MKQIPHKILVILNSIAAVFVASIIVVLLET